MTLGAATAGCAVEKVAQGADGRPRWDDERARRFVGTYVIIGLTYEGADGQRLRQEQLHGRISFADPTAGFCVLLEGVRLGMVYWMPPDLRSFQPALAGEYRLRSTGEIVANPDLLANWIVTEQAQGSPKLALQRLRTGPCPMPDGR
jgi:hypothetical protein